MRKCLFLTPAPSGTTEHCPSKTGKPPVTAKPQGVANFLLVQFGENLLPALSLAEISELRHVRDGHGMKT